MPVKKVANQIVAAIRKQKSKAYVTKRWHILAIINKNLPFSIYKKMCPIRFMSNFLLWFAENSHPIAATALALAMTLSMLSIINNLQDIMRMRGIGAFMPKYSS